MKKILVLLCLLPTVLFAQTGVFEAQKGLIGTVTEDIAVTHYLQNQPADTAIQSKFKVIEFWATWCAPCIKAVPHLNKLQEKFKDENIVFLSVTYESPAKTEATLQKVKFETVVATDTTSRLHTQLKIRDKGTMVVPRTVLIDNQNRIVWYGYPTQLTESLIKKFLKGGLSKP